MKWRIIADLEFDWTVSGSCFDCIRFCSRMIAKLCPGLVRMYSSCVCLKHSINWVYARFELVMIVSQTFCVLANLVLFVFVQTVCLGIHQFSQKYVLHRLVLRGVENGSERSAYVSTNWCAWCGSIVVYGQYEMKAVRGVSIVFSCGQS